MWHTVVYGVYNHAAYIAVSNTSILLFTTSTMTQCDSYRLLYRTSNRLYRVFRRVVSTSRDSHNIALLQNSTPQHSLDARSVIGEFCVYVHSITLWSPEPHVQ